MFTHNRLPWFRTTGDWTIDGPRLHKWLQDYFLSLEKKDALFERASTTPTVTSGSGTLTTATAAVEGQSVGGRFEFTATVTITTNGTGATNIQLTLPFSAAENTAVGGTRLGVATPDGLAARVNTAGVLIIALYDGTYPGADGYTLIVSGSYRKA